jgi:hypothetical protein
MEVKKMSGSYKENLKAQAASDVGVKLHNCKGCNGDLTSREAGSVGGRMNQLLWNSVNKQQ